MSYDIHFRRHADSTEDRAVISRGHRTLEDAKNSRKFNGDLVVHAGTNHIVCDEAWLDEHEKDDLNDFRMRAIRHRRAQMFLDEIYELDEAGMIDDAVREIIRYFDKHVEDKLLCDEVFRQIKFEDVSHPVIFSFFSTTFAMKEHVESRSYKYIEAYKLLSERDPKHAERLLGSVK
jgi:hypothetical protein